MGKKFNVGDKVRIARRVLEQDGFFNSWVDGMEDKIGVVDIVKFVSANGAEIRLVETGYGWPSDAFDLVEEAPTKKTFIEVVPALAKSVEQQLRWGLEKPVFGYRGKVYEIDGEFSTSESVATEAIFPIGVVEGKPVFAGTELWTGSDRFGWKKVKVVQKHDSCDSLQWYYEGSGSRLAGNPPENFRWEDPRPQGYTVELLEDDMKYLIGRLDPCNRNYDRINQALMKAKPI